GGRLLAGHDLVRHQRPWPDVPRVRSADSRLEVRDAGNVAERRDCLRDQPCGGERLGIQGSRHAADRRGGRRRRARDARRAVRVRGQHRRQTDGPAEARDDGGHRQRQARTLTAATSTLDVGRRGLTAELKNPGEEERMKNQLPRSLSIACVMAVGLASVLTSGQVQMCIGSAAPACQAVRGDRSEGWLPQTRSEVMARNGMVTTVQPLASQAGLRILQQGGNAIDAAVAAAAALNVTYPANTGIGGDLFALIYVAKEKKVYQLNASGIAPRGLTLATMNGLGYTAKADAYGPGSGMPSGGILTVTVPGSLWGWQEVLTRFGTRTFKDVLKPAIDYAEQGFPITEEIAAGWRMKNALPLKGCCTEVDPDSTRTFYVDGNRPATGTIFRNPDLAKTLRLVQAQGRDVFYTGEVARAIVAKSKALGGP